MGMFDVIGKIKKLNNGEKVKLTYSDVCNCIINIGDAKKNLTKEQYEEFYNLYKKFHNAKTTEYEVDMNGYYEMCFDIITKFDKIAPYEKYSGASEIETSFLMDEIHRIEKIRNEDNVSLESATSSFDSEHDEKEKIDDSNTKILNKYRTLDVKNQLIKKGVKLTEEEYNLYGNMFDIIANLTGNKLDNQTMIDVFDELSDLILGKKPNFMAIVTKEQRLKIQIRYMNEKGLLQCLSDEEKEIFAYCVLHATFIIVADNEGNMNSGLIDFDSAEHILNLLKEDKERQPEIYPTNEIKNQEEIKGEFGYSVDNPIHTTSIAGAYRLLRNVYYKNERVEIGIQAAISAKNGHLVDRYELKTAETRQPVTIYVDSYCNDNSEELPEGFSYETQNNIEPKKNVASNVNPELANNKEYIDACETINKLNETITFEQNPKSLGEQIVNALANDTTDKYYELVEKYNQTGDSDVLVEISNVLNDAANQLRRKQFPGSPICQARMETYCTPQLYWALEAAKAGNIEGFKIEQRIIKYGGRDRFNAPEELIKAIQTKFAYEGDSDMQYEMFHRYDPSEEHYFNGPAVNKAEKDQAKADYWMNMLVNNMNIIPNSSMIYHLREAKGPGVDLMFERAAEMDDEESYYHIANHFGIGSEIGFKFFKKCAESKDLWASIACSEVLHEYKRRNDKESCKQLLNIFVSQKDAYDRERTASKLYEEEYANIFKWIDDIEFDNAYMNSAISICKSEYYLKEATKIKNKHIRKGIFGNGLERRK